MFSYLIVTQFTSTCAGIHVSLGVLYDCKVIHPAPSLSVCTVCSCLEHHVLNNVSARSCMSLFVGPKMWHQALDCLRSDPAELNQF